MRASKPERAWRGVRRTRCNTSDSGASTQHHNTGQQARKLMNVTTHENARLVGSLRASNTAAAAPSVSDERSPEPPACQRRTETGQDAHTITSKRARSLGCLRPVPAGANAPTKAAAAVQCSGTHGPRHAPAKKLFASTCVVPAALFDVSSLSISCMSKRQTKSDQVRERARVRSRQHTLEQAQEQGWQAGRWRPNGRTHRVVEDVSFRPEEAGALQRALPRLDDRAGELVGVVPEQGGQRNNQRIAKMTT